MVGGGSVGLAGGASLHRWPGYAVPIEMAMYSIMTLGLVVSGFWSDRRDPRFWWGMSVVLPLHVLLLLMIRASFPFRSILVIVPIALTEGILAAVIILKMLGY
jgi:hypothetical protein